MHLYGAIAVAGLASPDGYIHMNLHSPYPTIPDFIIVGAAKAGTTSLFNYMGAHPQIFVPVIKEPRFFAFEDHIPTAGPGDRRWARSAVIERGPYFHLFSPRAPGQVCGEASVDYLSSPIAARRIHAHNADVRLIVVLRDPYERAFSHYLHMVQRGLEPAAGFYEALVQEPRRRNAGWAPCWGYIEASRYAKSLSRYLEFFPPESLLIIDYADLAVDPQVVLHRCFAHVGVDPDFVPDHVGHYYNRTVVNSSLPSRLIRRAAWMTPDAIRTRIPPRVRRTMRRRYDQVFSGARPVIEARAQQLLRRELADDIRSLADMRELEFMPPW